MVKGKKLIHCHGKDKGKTIHTFKSHAAALRAHRAIMANRRKSK